jgi:multimeric flavodoxin WrbA
MASKKILVVSGSARKGGNSDLLSDEFIRGARESGHDVTKIRIADIKINACLGCGVCMKNEDGCVQKDDLSEIYGKILESGIIVLVSPVYFYTFNAQIKTFMDRTFALHERLRDKTFYLLSTGAATSPEYMTIMLDTFRKYIGCFKNIKEGGAIFGCGVSNVGDIKNNPAMGQAYVLGKSA